MRVLVHWMWSRRLSSGMGGIREEEFIRAFTVALGDDSVLKKLDQVICGSLRADKAEIQELNSQLHEELKKHREDNKVLQREVKELRDVVLKKDARISTLEVQVNELHLKLDDQEQCSRRNSLRVTGVPENVNEDVGEKIVELCNAKLNLSDVQVKPEHIDRVHRAGPRREGVSSRPILVKFATYRTRQLVYKKRSSLNPFTTEARFYVLNAIAFST